MKRFYAYSWILLYPFLGVFSENCSFFNPQIVPPKKDYLCARQAKFLPFEDFEKKFKLGETSTEQLHPLTKTLSQTMHQNVEDGLSLLLEVDEKVIEGLERFIPSIETLAPLFAENIKQGGRIFLVGSGSSGRVAIDLAARYHPSFSPYQEQVIGVIAGGDSAMIRAKEGFEDSESDGEAVLQNRQLGSSDSVILISASGSASFNVGCGNYAAEQGAKVFYFYNSQSIPSRTRRLFERTQNPIIPLCVDIGPQAIAGSTRLQAATLAEVALGSLLGAIFYLNKDEEILAKEYPYIVAKNMRKGISQLRNKLRTVGKFVELERDIFSHPSANFRQVRDLTDKGYVTLIACEDSMREVLIDSTEISPTFSTNPIRKEEERSKKRAEFRAYLVGKKNNLDAWNTLIGREIKKEDMQDVETFILSAEADGLHSYQNRPMGEGNAIIGVAKLKDSPIPNDILENLETARTKGGNVALVLICNGKLNQKQEEQLQEFDGLVLVIPMVPHDCFGLTETVVLKQVLNLISNGAMILMNKVHGNQMIDVSASNYKLIDRCMRLIKNIWSQVQLEMPLSDKQLYEAVLQIAEKKKISEENGEYAPSVVKVILAMLALNKTCDDFQEVIAVLKDKQESVDWMGH